MTTTACQMCGYDPAAIVTASWSFFVPKPVSSLNASSTNKGGRRFDYKMSRDEWHWWFKTKRLELKIPTAARPRRVVLTRAYSGREAEMDRDNLVGGLKPAVDALVREGLLLGDSPDEAEIHYLQAPGKASGLALRIEETA